MLWHVNALDPMRKLFVTGSKVGLSARVPPTVTMLGAPNAPMQAVSGALTMLVPEISLPVTPLFHVLAPQADQMWPGIMVIPPRKSSVNGPLAFRLRSTVNSSKTLMLATLESEVAWNAPVALRSMKLYFTSQAVTGPPSCQWLPRFNVRRRSADVLAKYVELP